MTNSSLDIIRKGEEAVSHMKRHMEKLAEKKETHTICVKVYRYALAQWVRAFKHPGSRPDQLKEEFNESERKIIAKHTPTVCGVGIFTLQAGNAGGFNCREIDYSYICSGCDYNLFHAYSGSCKSVMFTKRGNYDSNKTW